MRLVSLVFDEKLTVHLRSKSRAKLHVDSIQGQTGRVEFILGTWLPPDPQAILIAVF